MNAVDRSVGSSWKQVSRYFICVVCSPYGYNDYVVCAFLVNGAVGRKHAVLSRSPPTPSTHPPTRTCVPVAVKVLRRFCCMLNMRGVVNLISALFCVRWITAFYHNLTP